MILQEKLTQTAQQTREPKELDFYADLNDFLTTDEVAKILKVSNSYLAKLRFDSYNKDKDGNLRADHFSRLEKVFATKRAMC